MPSFDVVSEVNLQEVDNALNQARKEIATRFDFRGSKSKIDWAGKEKDPIEILSDNETKLKAVIDVLQTKLVKRGVDIQAIEFGKKEPAGGNAIRVKATLVNGIETEKAKEVVKAVKDLKIKVQAQIADEKVRVSGKNRDDLQEVIQALKGLKFDIPLQFNNFRE